MSSPVAIQSTGRCAGGTVGLGEVSPFGWWWRRSPKQPGSPATRSCGGSALASMDPAVPGWKKSGKERGKGQRGRAVPDREKTGVEEACTARTPTSRGGGARARSRARAALETNGWCGRLIRSVGERQGVRERLGVALYRLAEVHRRRGLRVPAGSARVAVREGMEGSGVFVGVV